MNKGISFDFNNLMAEVIGKKQGITEQDIKDFLPTVNKGLKSIETIRSKKKDRIAAGMEWMQLPYEKDHVFSIKELAQKVRERFENVLVLGIGGSYLGPFAVHKAINGSYYNDFAACRKGHPRIFFEGNNVDSETIGNLLNHLTLKNTAVIVVSKSGETTETKAAFNYTLDKMYSVLGEAANENIIAVTDPEKGTLRKQVINNNWVSYPIPEGVGGRFSVLCPVGLVPAAMTGIDIAELLQGAADMDKRCKSKELWKNPALLYAALCTIAYLKKKKNIATMMPFSDSLKYMANWYVQLLAESLGKKFFRDGKVANVGRVPLPAVGTSDLHANGQQMVEGEYNQLITLLKVEDFREDFEVPGPKDDFLTGKKLSEVMAAAFAGNKWAITRENRANATITLPKIDEYNLGQLIYFFEMAVAFEGEFLNVNTYDQPGVEGYKNYMYVKLGKPVSEEIRNEVESKPEVILDKYVL